MRITMLIDHLGCGGAQRQFCLVAAELKQRGHDVEIFTYHNKDFLRSVPDSVGIPVHVIESSSYLKRFLRLRNEIRRSQPDTVITFLDTPAKIAQLANLPGRCFRLIVSERTFDAAGPTWSSWLRLKMHHLADAIVTNNQAQHDFISNVTPSLKPRLHTIPNCVELCKFTPSQTPPAKEDSFVVLGNFGYHKNPVNFFRGFRKFIEQTGNETATVDWYGANFLQDGQSTKASQPYETLRAEMKASQLGNRFRTHAPVSEVLPIYQAASAICLPSIQEGFPNTIGEAMACGKPVLASNIGGVPELVSDPNTGILFDPHNVDEIASSFERFVQMDSTTKAAMGIAAREYVETHLAPTVLGDRYEALLGIHEESARAA